MKRAAKRVTLPDALKRATDGLVDGYEIALVEWAVRYGWKAAKRDERRKRK